MLNEMLRRDRESSAMAPWWVLLKAKKFQMRQLLVCGLLSCLAFAAPAEVMSPAQLHFLEVNAAEPEATQAWRRGVYIWDSRALLNPATRTDELSRLDRTGIQRLYIGLSAEQLAQPEVVRTLDAVAITLRKRGFEPVLLLGDPDWMAPEHRASLIAIIWKLKSVSFSALHLDLEVEQRGWPVPAKHVREWLDTLKGNPPGNQYPSEVEFSPYRIKEILREDIAFFGQPDHRHPQAG